ncbi:MAG: zinc-dependent metalloprotease [Porphyromonas sp.]|uniref:zinc-dependent metalloprotease n=1 Tax=Porphyromonas sp. TaxID=1924944 RepID=UPI001CACB827|nr:zinc-dependent metalloprotease [Porphyromonas sp.]MBF1405406.1 zinc-dependent metalloprotease [Porphyromonas sp.]
MHKSCIRCLLVATAISAGSLSLAAAPSALSSRAFGDDTKKEKKEEDKYTKFFKDKKVETARGKFVTLHKIDGNVYLELPTKYLGKELMMGAKVTSTTDPDYLAVGSMNSAPIVFRFEKQDSVIVMKAPNSIVYRRDASPELQKALELNYRDQSVESFTPEVYKADSSAVVLKINSLVTESSPFFEIVPSQQGPFKITSSRNSSLTFVRGLKSFDSNASVRVEMNFSVNASLMGVLTVAKDMPLTAEVTYTILPVEASNAIPRFADARVGYQTTRKVSFPDYLDQSEPVYLAHRWQLVPKDKKAYAKGQLTEPEKKIVFYLDSAFPASWQRPIREGVLRWNKAFEAAGFRNAIEVRDFPKNDKQFDPDNLEYSCIRYIPNSQETIAASNWTDPRTGEIFSGNLTIYNNVEALLHKQRFIGTAAVDPQVRSSRLPQALFEESLSQLVTQEMGSVLGLLHNYAASASYTTDQLRSAKFTKESGLTPSILDGVTYNYLAQPSDKGVRLINDQLGVYDLFAIDWGYRYFDLKGDPAAEAKELLSRVDKRAREPYLRYAPEQRYAVDPTVRTEDLGNDPIKTAELTMKNLAFIQSNLSKWITNDPDSRKKKSLYLAIVQGYYLQLKNAMSLVGGVVCQESRLSTSLPRYQVVPKAKQREAFQWLLRQAKDFQGKADRNFERKGFIDVSYYDQLLEFLVKDIYDLRSRIIIASQVDSKTYSLGEYFDDLYQATFASTIAGKSPNHMERLMQIAFIDKSIAGTVNPRNATPGMPYSFAGAPTSVGGKLISLTSTTDYSDALKSGRVNYGGGDPSASIYPMANVPALDTSEQYMYAALLKVRPLLEQRAASTTDRTLKAHYQTLAFKVAKLLDAKK